MGFQKYHVGAYRYAFNGMEKDDDINGENNSYDFGARLLDVRLGRWLTIDPIQLTYPELSGYNFVANNPLIFIDPNGKKFVNPYKEDYTKAKTKVDDAKTKYDEMEKAHLEKFGELKKKERKKIEEDSGLNAAQDEFKAIGKKYQLVEDLIFTLQKVSPAEYKYFEELKDGLGNEVSIVVNIAGVAPEAGLCGRTRNLTQITKDGDQIFITQGNGGIQIDLFEKDALDPNCKPEQGCTQIRQKGHNFKTFANELGDIKFMIDNVKDMTSFKFWEETCMYDSNPDDNKGYQDPNGAGVKSFEYEKARANDFKNYSPAEGESKNMENQTIQKNEK